MTTSALDPVTLHRTAQRDAAASAHDSVAADLPVIIIGGGVTGVRAANRLAQAGQSAILFNAEPFAPYNRVKLTPLLAGDVQLGEITLPTQTDGATPVARHDGMRVVRIDRADRQVITADGGSWPYRAVILATGSTAFIPAIPGRDLAGVFTFRDASDASALLARSISARRVVVIGGGLLGLEAARGMQRRGAVTTIIEHENRLMPRQLDETGAALLRSRIEDLGVQTHTGIAVRELVGEGRVEAAILRDGQRIPCDTVIVCTGVRANSVLAQEADLSFSRGVLVDDHMRSSDPDIYAVGECAEHRGAVIGLVGPGLEQADVAVDSILDAPRHYTRGAPATKLKVLGADVFSIGDVEQLDSDSRIRSLAWRDDDCYRRLFLSNSRLVGAVAVGPCPEANRFQDAVQRGGAIGFLQQRRFAREGRLLPEAPEPATNALPDTAIVCNCTGVTCGRLREAIAEGARDIDALRAATGASTVCGTCAPQIDTLIESGAPPRPIRLFRPILVLSALGAVMTLATLVAPRIPIPDRFGPSVAESLWLDGITKQWTGYILLAITVAAMTLGLRKRIRPTRRLGAYDWWRIVHLMLGALAVIGLCLHTGFRPGSNLNLILFLSFSLTLAFGAIAGLATGGDHRLRANGVGDARTPPRILPTWLHILAIWPLPALLLAHVLVVYAF